MERNVNLPRQFSPSSTETTFWAPPAALSEDTEPTRDSPLSTYSYSGLNQSQVKYNLCLIKGLSLLMEVCITYKDIKIECW